MPATPLASLDLLARRRAPYADALAAIVGDVVARFPPLGGQPLIEIGAGAGALVWRSVRKIS